MDLSTQLQRVAWAASAAPRLAKSVREWAALEPWTISGKIAEDRLSYVFRIDIKNKPPLDEWGFMFGDAIHNLRSALNTAVVSIAKQSGMSDEKTLKKLQFPIAVNPKEWAENGDRIKGLPQGVQDKILKVQPFNQVADGSVSPDDRLYVLRELSNEDKHRVEMKAALDPMTLQQQCTIEFETEEGASASVPPDMTVYPTSLVDGGTLFDGRTKGRIAKIVGKYGIGTQVRVRLPDGRMIEIAAVLEGLCKHTEKVLREMAD